MGNDMLAKILKALGMAIIGIIIVVSVLLVLPFQKYVIQSGSMEPALPVGSVVYVHYDSPENIKTGDIVTFYANENSAIPTTHRVVENDSVKHQFITKGDANEKEDITPISWELYIGKVTFYIPVIGFALSSLATLQGKIMLVAALMSGIVLLELAIVLDRKTK